MDELEHDANCIISLLATTESEFSGVVKNLKEFDITMISEWIAESLDLIYTAKKPPKIEDYNDESIKTLGASNGACMVTAVITQWLVRYMCKKLMQLMTPEAVILKRKYIAIC